MTGHTKAELDNNEHNLQGVSCIEYVSGDKWWYKNGKIYREDGPAIEFSDGRKFWFVGGEWCTKESYEEALKIWKIGEAMK